MKLAIIIPAYNEETVIRKVVEGIPKHIHGIQDIAIIIIDDGSTDKTYEKAKEIDTIVLRHMINRGQGAAVQTGICAAKKLGADIIITKDGDGQHDSQDIEQMIQPILKNEADIVNGSRFLRKQHIPALRRAYNFFANFLTWLMSGKYLSDSQSGMKALNKKAIEKMYITANGYEFCTEMIREASWHKLRITEIPINVSYSEYSMSKGQSFAVGLGTIFKLIIRSLTK